MVFVLVTHNIYFIWQCIQNFPTLTLCLLHHALIMLAHCAAQSLFFSKKFTISCVCLFICCGLFKSWCYCDLILGLVNNKNTNNFNRTPSSLKRWSISFILQYQWIKKTTYKILSVTQFLIASFACFKHWFHLAHLDFRYFNNNSQIKIEKCVYRCSIYQPIFNIIYLCYDKVTRMYDKRSHIYYEELALTTTTCFHNYLLFLSW